MIEVVPSTTDHVRELTDNMRQSDRDELIRLGLEPSDGLFFSYEFSVVRKTALIDGKVAAMWGVFGTPTGITGQPYLLTSPLVETISPFKFAKIYKNEVEQMKKLFPVLQNYVDASYTGAVRMLKIAGFILEEATLNDNAFYKFSMTEDQELRKTAGVS